MRRGLTSVLLAATAAFLLAGSGATSPRWDSGPLSFSQSQKQIFQPVDQFTWCGDCVGVDYTTQEPWVVNPSRCQWDSDDTYVYRSDGTVLNPAASVSVTECAYSGIQHQTDIRFASSSADLSVTVSFSSDTYTETHVVPPVLGSDGRYHYDACIHIAGGFPGTVLPIAGSHDGYAALIAITTTVSNPSPRKAHKSTGWIEAGVRPWVLAGCGEF